MINCFFKAFKNIRRKHKKIEILAKSKLSSSESIILKTMQDSNSPEKDYVFVSDDVNMYCKLKEGIVKRL